MNPGNAVRVMAGIGISLLAATCSSGSEHAAPAMVGSAGAAASGGARVGSSAGEAGAGPAADADGGAAGAAGEAGAAGTSGEAAGESSRGGSGGAAPAFPCAAGGASSPPTTAHCDPRAALTQVGAVPVKAGNNPRLIAVTPDELTIAWSTLGSFGAQFQVADRAAASAGFDDPVLIATDDAVVGLSPDGLRLITLSQDGTSYQELSRDTRGSDFSAASVTAFSLIDAAAPAFGLVYSDCVVSADDRTLIYTAQSRDGQEYPVRISVRSGSEPWPVGSAIMSCELQRHDGLVRNPTGLSTDGLTLFFFDPDRQSARAAWRASQSADFTFFADLPAGIGRATVNADCSKLYYSGAFANAMLQVASGP